MKSTKDRPHMDVQAGAFGSTRAHRVKLALGSIVFVLLTVSIFLYQFSLIEHGDKSFTWGNLRFEYLWLIILCLPFDTLASGLRIWLVCHVLQPGTGFWTCLKAEWANAGIAMLTPSNLRNSKTYQFIFINKRPIRDPSLTHAVYNAYEEILPHKKHPVFFLSLMINPGVIDVNVHPTKREVRFENKEPVYNFVLTGIRDALPQPAQNVPYSIPSHALISEALDLEYKPSISFIPLGHAFIALSGREGLTLIDQHAAHERILYERLIRGADLNSHPLLFPRQVQLSHKEYHVIHQ